MTQSSKRGECEVTNAKEVLNQLQEIVNQLESCNYECEAGPLSNNVSFVQLKKIAEGKEVNVK